MPVISNEATARVFKGSQEISRIYRGSTLLWGEPTNQTKDVFSLADYTNIEGRQFQSGEIYSRLNGSGVLYTSGGWLKSNNPATYIRGASNRFGTQQITATLRMFRGRARMGPAVRIQPNGDCYFLAYSFNVLQILRRIGGSNSVLNQIVAPDTPEYATGTIHTIQVTSYTDGSFEYRMGNIVKTRGPDSNLPLPLDGGACGLRAEENTGDNSNLSDLDIQVIGT